MKTKLLLLAVLFSCIWIINSGFSPNDDNPKWSQDPRTRINIDIQGDYIPLPVGDNGNFSNETRYISTPQGVFAVGPNFRVHPTTSRTQSEVPITRHPRNPNFMFASANTYNVGGSTTFSTAHYVTTNGGVSFFGDDTTNFNFGDPGPMVMHTNRLIISYITSTGSMGAAYSTNLGTSWSGTVTFPGATTSADKNLSAVDGEPTSAYYGRLYTVYTEFAGANFGRIVATWSSNGGVTWSSVVPISPVPSAGHHHQGCDVAVDPYGWVRVVYANCTTNGQNSTEDYLGWAESGNGGVTWADMSDTKVNMNGIRSSDLLPSPPASVIRANGFPRIDIDRTCLLTSDDAYVVAGEKNFAPALDNADIVLMKTPNGGSTWTRVRVNQNAAGSYEYFPAVNVDATGGINVCYYSTRNSPNNDSAQIYLSRSTDGGTSWVDVLVSDHKFKPVPILGQQAVIREIISE
ncbi:MAG: exo-alpha-sialidase [Ignavibacteria bacterium]|nr:exo-alpha-sialidase [Ignavibacteria bacterium]